MPKKQNEKPESEIKITTGDNNRLDRFLAARFPKWSRTYFKRLINNRNIKVDSHPVSAHHELKLGQVIQINWPTEKKVKPVANLDPLPFPILYEDDYMFVINKPAHMLCHPAGWKKNGNTLVELLRPRITNSEWPDEVRPGLVHRLDRDTSGVLLFAKTPDVHVKLSHQFASRQVKKTYIAVVHGKMEANEGTLECQLSRDLGKRQRFAVAANGKIAITKFIVKKRIGDVATVVTLHPLTGRTHQLRVQLSSYGFPILGDLVYGGVKKEFLFIPRQLLHAAEIEFTHPVSNKKMSFKAPIPDDFQQALKLIRLKA